MHTVLSIQSFVSYGHAGNASATFPLQRLGVTVMPVHTVLFSNHTGYATWRGPLIPAGDVADVITGIDERGALATTDAVLTGYLGAPDMGQVILIDPRSTFIDAEVTIGQDVTIHPGTQLHGKTVIGNGSEIGPDSTLTDMVVGENARVIRTHGFESVIGNNADIGPFTYIRPGTVVGEHGKLGGFVEIKKATIGYGSKVPHLTYVGDATIGEHSNIGASSVFVNYDGVHKHHTTIGSHVRTGSDTMFIAPVSVGDGAYSGAGTVIREDVPPGALVVSGGQQRNIEGWVQRKRPGTPAAEAAARALGEAEATTTEG